MEQTFSSLHSLESVNAGHICSYLPTAFAPSCRSWHMRQIAARKKWSLAPCLSNALSIDELPSYTTQRHQTSLTLTKSIKTLINNVCYRWLHSALHAKRASFLLGSVPSSPNFTGDRVIPWQSVDTVRIVVDRITTLPLELFRQWNFVADF